MLDAVPNSTAAIPKLNQERTMRTIGPVRLLSKSTVQILYPAAAEVPAICATVRVARAVIPNANDELPCSEQRLPSSFKSLAAFTPKDSRSILEEASCLVAAPKIFKEHWIAWSKVIMTYNTESDKEVKKKGIFAAVVVCWFLGNGSLIPWNSMLTIVDYYAKVYPRYHPTRVLTLVYQPFALTICAILTYHEAKINTRIRNIFGYTLFSISSLLLIIIDLASFGKEGVGTFIAICLISAAFGVADAHVQGGMVGDLSFMQPVLIQSYLAGMAASGVLTSLLRIITKSVFEHSHDGLRKGAMLFFALSTFLELLCVLLYAHIFPNLPIVKYYRSKAASEGSKTVSADLVAAGIQLQNKQEAEEDPVQQERLTITRLLMQNMDYALDMYLIYILTLSIFPGFLAEDSGSHALGSWYAIVIIAVYNSFDLIGRYTPMIKLLRIKDRRGLMIAILSRFLFIPAFYFMSKNGGQGWMIMLTSLLGLTNGHLSVCVITQAPKGYKGPEANALGNVLVLFILAGISSGAALDWLWLIGKGW